MNETRLQPPKYAVRFLEAICPTEYFEEIEGDLTQKFNRDVTNFGERKARRRFIWNAIRFFRH